MNEEDIIYKIALSLIPNIGAIRARNLISYLGGIDKVFKAKKSHILKVPGIGEKLYQSICNQNALLLAQKEYDRVKNLGLNIIFYSDKNYPQRLKHQNDCPLLLYTSGNLDLNPFRTVGIIGTRLPTEYGKEQCTKIVKDIAKYNVTIISGLAYGIDTTAHLTAIQNQIPTIAVLGNGLNSVYPATNYRLSEKMKANGGLISEYPILTAPDKENFPKRNRIIASLSDVLIVIESARKGGSFITAEFANNYSKDVFALPGKLTDKMSEGCNQLIKTHKAHMYTSVEDIAYINRWDIPQKPKQLSLVADLNADEQKILEIIRQHPKIGMDSMVYQSQIQLSNLSSILIHLEFEGLIKSLPGKKFILTS